MVILSRFNGGWEKVNSKRSCHPVLRRAVGKIKAAAASREIVTTSTEGKLKWHQISNLRRTNIKLKISSYSKSNVQNRGTRNMQNKRDTKLMMIWFWSVADWELCKLRWRQSLLCSGGNNTTRCLSTKQKVSYFNFTASDGRNVEWAEFCRCEGDTWQGAHHPSHHGHHCHHSHHGLVTNHGHTGHHGHQYHNHHWHHNHHQQVATSIDWVQQNNAMHCGMSLSSTGKPTSTFSYYNILSLGCPQKLFRCNSIS